LQPCALGDRQRQRGEGDAVRVSGAFRRLANILDQRETQLDDQIHQTDEPLVQACRLVGAALGVQIRRRPDPVDGRAEAQTLETIARTSRLGVRRVLLREDWWRGDYGPLLGYLRAGDQPVALLPLTSSRYEIVNPADGSRAVVSAQIAQTLAPYGVMFYRTLPRRASELMQLDLLRFGLFGLRGDLLRVLAMGVGAGLLGLVTPLFIGILFDTVLPSAQVDQLLELSALLLVAALATALFQITRTLAVLRIEVKVEASLQAAVWDRLLNLPVPFFREYTAGDLSNRAMGVSSIRRAVSGTVVLALLTGVFSVFNFGLLFTIDLDLALLATGLFLVAVGITLLVGVFHLRYQRVIANIQGRIAGAVLQFITGITKLRVAGVEGRAFALWSRDFSEQKRVAFRSRRLQNALTVFQASYPILTMIALFAAVAGDTAQLSTGTFLAFYAAFTQFLLASLNLSAAYLNLLNVVPTYERLQPILKAEPEVDEAKSDPGTLTGEIEVNRLAFRYREGGLQALRDVSFHVRPGEFIALVGPSGSGKSTLFRVLLGFEKPESGAIFYDGQDLAGLDIRAVRQQMGVVLQNSQLMYGDIFTNIVGVTDLTLDAAWEAAALAGLDDDIRAMPMGMHTMVSEGGTTLSGGQRQRLLIARAIAIQPRILFFDEATSALDNRTQAVVSRSLESLDATRIVIAHRLSTIVNADRILVMEGGRIVQMGSYPQLMAQEGLFAALAKRQLM
jgi:ATP-binding cassette subfamily C protein